MRIAVFLTIITLSIIPGRANLGDTMDQCSARYGQRLPPSGVSDPYRLGGDAARFQKDGYYFDVYLFNGLVGCECITKTDNSRISAEERTKVVQMESAEGNWAKPVTAQGQLVWVRDDGSAICCYPESTPLIFAMSKAYLDLAAEAKKTALKFPSEAEVRSYLVPGMSEEDVIKKFGIPPIRMPSTLPGGGEDWTYTLPPAHKDVTYGYGGFEVVVRNGKVADWSIIHQSVKISK
jgi:hypothetical protein